MCECKHHYVYLYTKEMDSYIRRYWKYGQYETTAKILIPEISMAFYGCTECSGILITEK